MSYASILRITVTDPPVRSLAGWQTRVRPLRHLRRMLAAPRETRPIHLDIFRHGETSANASGVVSGVADVPLSDRRREEAALLGSKLEGRYAAAFHSPLLRSRETLDLALRESSARVDYVIEDPRIAERSMGVLEGEPLHPLPAYDAGDLTWAPPGGEPYVDVFARMLSFLLDLTSVAAATEGELRLIVCAHTPAR